MYRFSTGVFIGNPELAEEVLLCLANLHVVPQQINKVELLPRLKPDLLLVDPGASAEPLEELVRKLRSASPETAIAIVHRSAEPELILGAMRAGAVEFIFPPFDKNLTAALDRLAAQQNDREFTSRPGGKFVGFVSAKGGAGASSIACHVAAGLQRITTEEILLADFDLESGLVGFLMKTKTQYSILDALKNVNRLDLSFWKALVTADRPRLDLLPAPASVKVQEAWTSEQLSEVCRKVRSLYGWVIADLGSSCNLVTLSLAQELDALFLVATPNVLGLYRAKQFVQNVVDAGFPRNRINVILNRVPQRRDLTQDEIEKLLGVSIYAELADRSELDEAYTDGKLLGPDTVLGRQLSALAMKMAGVHNDEKPKGRYSFFPWKKTSPEFSGT